MLDAGAERVAYVDVDVHHGDGVERVFWDDDRVLTISLHESGRWLFPGTGFPEQTGGPSAEGVGGQRRPAARHRRLVAGCARSTPSSRRCVRAFEPAGAGLAARLRHPRARPARPPGAVRSTRCGASYEAIHDLAHEVCDGRWVATGGGGYEVVDVVPRAWTHLAAIAAHRPIAPGTAVPESWREYVQPALRPAGARGA